MDIDNIIQTIITFLVSSGLTVGIIIKFGQTWFFKWIEQRSAFSLAEKNNELLKKLEMKKRDLNKELQIDVSLYKSQLEVLGKQNSIFLERKIGVILELNKYHYKAIEKIKDYIDYCSLQINQAGDYFIYQIEDKETDQLSSYETYEKMISKLHDEKKIQTYDSYNDYKEFFSLNMPILSESLLREELIIVEQLLEVLEDSELKFKQTMNTCIYILNPEENETTINECIKLFKAHSIEVTKYKSLIDNYSTNIVNKSIKSGKIIESMIKF